MGAGDGRPLVVFDFDGTLADTWLDIANALNRTLTDAALPPVEGPEVRFWIGEGVLPLLERAVPDTHRDPRSIEALYTRFRDHYERGCLETTRLYPGVTECLAALEGAALAIASNKPHRFLDLLVDALDLRRHFPVVAAGDTLEWRKPAPQVLGWLRERFPEPLGPVWMVGDSAIDARTGFSAGAHTIGCAWGLRGRAELEQAGVEHLVDHPAEIPPLVLGRPPATR
jgi:phosphoglycolate phosphatase